MKSVAFSAARSSRRREPVGVVEVLVHRQHDGLVARELVAGAVEQGFGRLDQLGGIERVFQFQPYALGQGEELLDADRFLLELLEFHVTRVVGLALFQLGFYTRQTFGIVGQMRFHRGHQLLHFVQSGHGIFGLVEQGRGARLVAHAGQACGEFDVIAGRGRQVTRLFQGGLHECGVARLLGRLDQRLGGAEVGCASQGALIQGLGARRIAQRLGDFARQRQQVGHAGELLAGLVEDRRGVILVEQVLGRGRRQLAVLDRARDFRLGLFQHLLGKRAVGDDAHHVLRQIDQRVEVAGFLQRLFIRAHCRRLVAQHLELGLGQCNLLLARHAVILGGLQQFLGAALFAQRLVDDGARRQVLGELAVVRHAVHQLLGVGRIGRFLQGFQRQGRVIGAAAALGFFGGEGVAGGHGVSPDERNLTGQFSACGSGQPNK